MSEPQLGATEVLGRVSPGFEGVLRTFASHLATGTELGAAFCAHVDGRLVVDMWGGRRQLDSAEPYDDSTLQLIFSATKGIAALCVHMLVQQGLLDLDEPVTRWWPEFGAEGKDHIPVRWLLAHTAGLPTVDAKLSPEQVFAWEPVCQALAQQRPFWKPGTGYGYHALTFGWLVGEVFRRASGRTLGRFLADEVAGPLGLDMWIGLPPALASRVAPVVLAPDVIEAPGVDPASLLVRTATLNHALGPLREWVNDPASFSAEIPAGNAITNARSLSRLYAAMIGRVDDGPAEPLIDPGLLRAACVPQTSGLDLVFGSAGFPVTIKIGTGFWVHSEPAFPFGGPAAFGHPGTSGALGFADPEHGVACGYVTNKMTAALGADPRSSALVRAVYEGLTAR